MKKISFLALFVLGTYYEVFAQTYMHEAAEDSEGGGIYGVLSLLIFIGIGNLVGKLFSKENSKKNNRYK